MPCLSDMLCLSVSSFISFPILARQHAERAICYRPSVCPSVRPSVTRVDQSTIKLCYRKVDRAMRPIHGCPENFGTPWLRPRLLFLTFFSRAFVRIDPMNAPTKSEVRSFIRNSWDNRGYQKIREVAGYAHAPFSQKFLIGFYSDWPSKRTSQIWNP